MMDTIKKGAKVIVLLIICSGFTSVTGAQDPIVRDLYLKDGTVTHCDSVWKGLGDFVWCNEGGNVKGYPTSDVDMNKTFDIQLIEVAGQVRRPRLGRSHQVRHRSRYP